jgi:hypothetical protein
MKRSFLLAALIPILLVTGCDTADVTVDAEAFSPLAITADAAEAAAGAIAVGPGGLLNEIVDATIAFASITRSETHAGACERERYWDADIERWVRSIHCERGEAKGDFYALFSRLHHFGFFDDDGNLVRQPTGAETMTVDLVDGDGIRRTPRMSHTLLDIGASFEISDLPQELVTANGSYARAATDTLRGQDRMRTLTYELTLDFEDVVGPRRAAVMGASHPGHPAMSPLHRSWALSVSGTVHGHISGEVSMTNPGGTRTREFERSFTITFGEGGETGRMHFSGTNQSFLINLITGSIQRG